MANTQNGTAVNFTFQSAAGITITEITGILLQSASYKKNANRTLVKDGNGDRTSSLLNDKFNSATLEWVVEGSSLSAALTNTALRAPGAFITITACATLPEIVDATKQWEVLPGCEIKGTNENAKTVTMEIEYAVNIQAVAT